MTEPELWSGTKKILVILAHPDDPEFFCGATIARWTSTGHIVKYVLLTHGDKGSPDRTVTGEALSAIRLIEQENAARVLGVQSVEWFNYPDGYLEPSIEARRDVVRAIRAQKPDIIVTCDPLNMFPNEARINHPDHRAAGQIVVDAVFPAAGNVHYFPELLAEGLEPHSVQEVWMSVTGMPNIILDVTDTWPKKMEALHCHASQIGDPRAFDERMLTRRTPASTPETPRFEERFRRIKFE